MIRRTRVVECTAPSYLTIGNGRHATSPAKEEETDLFFKESVRPGPGPDANYWVNLRGFMARLYGMGIRRETWLECPINMLSNMLPEKSPLELELMSRAGNSEGESCFFDSMDAWEAELGVMVLWLENAGEVLAKMGRQLEEEVEDRDVRKARDRLGFRDDRPECCYLRWREWQSRFADLLAIQEQPASVKDTLNRAKELMGQYEYLFVEGRV